MNTTARSLGGGILMLAAAFVVFSQLGVIDMRWPWENPHIADVESFVGQSEQARIVEIQPIALDCRARIRSEVPVEGRREHKLFGQVYRTDTVDMVAIGDIDTCVPGDATKIVTDSAGNTKVTVSAESIRFERPRVDAIATLDSVAFDKGLIGKFTDALPWVSDGDGLTPAAYAYAQTVIGSSECMSEAYEATTFAMTKGYRDQVEAQGGPADQVQVVFVGEPDFGTTTTDPADLARFDFTAAPDAALCAVAQGAFSIESDAATL